MTHSGSDLRRYWDECKEPRSIMNYHILLIKLNIFSHPNLYEGAIDQLKVLYAVIIYVKQFPQLLPFSWYFYGRCKWKKPWKVICYTLTLPTSNSWHAHLSIFCGLAKMLCHQINIYSIDRSWEHKEMFHKLTRNIFISFMLSFSLIQ